MKLKREAHLLYINTNLTGTGSASWFLVGKHIEDMSVDLGADVESVKNILGETSVNLNGYEPTISAEPYYANPSDSIYTMLKASAMERVMDDAHCKTEMLEVIIEDTSQASHSAWKQDCYVVPESIGGDTSGLQIPFTVHPEGERTAGTVTLTSERVPTFIAATGATGTS